LTQCDLFAKLMASSINMSSKSGLALAIFINVL